MPASTYVEIDDQKLPSNVWIAFVAHLLLNLCRSDALRIHACIALISLVSFTGHILLGVTWYTVGSILQDWIITPVCFFHSHVNEDRRVWHLQPHPVSQMWLFFHASWIDIFISLMISCFIPAQPEAQLIYFVMNVKQLTPRAKVDASSLRFFCTSGRKKNIWLGNNKLVLKICQIGSTTQSFLRLLHPEQCNVAFVNGVLENHPMFACFALLYAKPKIIVEFVVKFPALFRYFFALAAESGHPTARVTESQVSNKVTVGPRLASAWKCGVWSCTKRAPPVQSPFALKCFIVVYCISLNNKPFHCLPRMGHSKRLCRGGVCRFARFRKKSLDWLQKKCRSFILFTLIFSR